MKEKKGLSRYRKQSVILKDLVNANIDYLAMIIWVPNRNGTEWQQKLSWMPNIGMMILCLDDPVPVRFSVGIQVL